MTQVYVDGRRTSIAKAQSYVIRKALMSGMDAEEQKSLYLKGFSDSLDGAHARDLLMNEGVEIVLGD